MAHGASPASRMGKQLDPYKTAVTLDVLTDYVDFNSYNIWIPGTAFHDYALSSTTTFAVSTGIVGRAFPTGKTNGVVYSFRRPRQWLKGRVSGRIWWTGVDPAGSDARLAFGFRGTKEDEAFSSSAISEVTVSLGTFSDLFLKIIRDENIATSMYIDASIDMVTVVFIRDGVSGFDTYASDFNLLGIEVYYTEASSDVSYKIRNDKKNVSMP